MFNWEYKEWDLVHIIGSFEGRRGKQPSTRKFSGIRLYFIFTPLSKKNWEIAPFLIFNWREGESVNERDCQASYILHPKNPRKKKWKKYLYMF